MPRKTAAPPSPTRPVNFSVRLSEEDAKRLEALAAAKDWPAAKTIQKLVVAALDARLLK